MSKNKSPRAFSYRRFSQASQGDGGSVVRQTRMVDDYCKRKRLTLDDSLTLDDFGVSAFRGANVREGALAAFLEACRTGRVPKGSTLIVESLDRLSRDQIRPALQLFLQLQDYGIAIVTLQPEREYKPDNTDALALIEPLIVFARAHEESLMKSHRRKDGWKQARDKARAGGGPMMKTCPAWLKVTPGGFQVKQEAAATVQRIFALAREGLGVYRIAERLNREKVPAIATGREWVKNYVYKILTSAAAVGSYQPCRQEGKSMVPDGPPIPEFYPAVVSQEEWDAAQAAVRQRSNGRGAGRKGAEETNLFTGLLHHGGTTERLHIINALGREHQGERKRYRYLVPSRESGTRSGERIDYHVFEAAVLSLLKELKPADVAPDGAPGNGRHAEIARLSGKLLDIDSRLERTRQRARTAGDFDAFLDLIQDLQGERQQVSDRKAELEEEEDGGHTADLGETHGLIDLLDNARPDQRADLRLRLKGRVRQLVSGIWVVMVRQGRKCLCAVQLYFRAGAKRRDYLILHKPGTKYGPSQWWCRSLATVGKAGDLDLRKKKDVRDLERLLTELELDEAEG